MRRPLSREVGAAAGADAPRLSLVPQPDRRRVLPPCAQVLCRYVGTNVIAATKIVKKHDKHVQPSLRKRVVVGNIIRSSKVLAELVQYSSTVQRGGAPSSKVTPSDNGVAPTEEEAEMRGLPDWLLSGAKENDAASETAQSEEEPPGWHYPSFFSTYLDDW